MAASAHVIALNYHHISSSSTDATESLLHTVPLHHFKQQIKYAASIGALLSIDQVVDAEVLPGLSFLVMFDDVPIGALEAASWLDENSIPYALSPCATLAYDGFGTRDKVYRIIRALPSRYLRDAVRDVLGDTVADDPSFSFYHLTKSDVLHPTAMLERIVEPLYARISTTKHLPRQYLNWPTLASLAARPGVTIVNHGWSHSNYAALSRQEREDDIARGHQAIIAELGLSPEVFAVPFGFVTQELLVHLTAALSARGYRCLLWTEGFANAIAPRYIRRDFLSLLRIHVANTLHGFQEQLSAARSQPVTGPIQLIVRRDIKRVPTVRGEDMAIARGFELVVRPDKDYAASEEFLSYLKRNPVQSPIPGLIGAFYANELEAAIYPLGCEFVLHKKVVRGAYISSWRRLREASVNAAAAILRELLRMDVVLGAYRPSIHAEPAFRHWLPVGVTEHCLPATACAALRHDRGLTIIRRERWDRHLQSAADRFVTAAFTVRRSRTFYEWRFAEYPLASVTYFAARRGGRTVGFAVVQYGLRRAAVVDFAADSDDTVVALIAAASALLDSRKDGAILVQTSSPTLTEALRALGGESESFTNYYFFPRSLGLAAQQDTLRPDGGFHETMACGDVLLRVPLCERRH